MHKEIAQLLIKELRQKSLDNKLANKEKEFLKNKIISLEECRPMQNRKEYFGKSSNWSMLP